MSFKRLERVVKIAMPFIARMPCLAAVRSALVCLNRLRKLSAKSHSAATVSGCAARLITVGLPNVKLMSIQVARPYISAHDREITRDTTTVRDVNPYFTFHSLRLDWVVESFNCIIAVRDDCNSSF